MNLLRESGLFGAGLVLVHTPKLVSRYNACLQAIGVAPTQLASFSIDGIGWSRRFRKRRARLNTSPPALQISSASS